LGIILKNDHGKIFRVENRKFFGVKYLNEGHREFGVPGNVILQKSPVYAYMCMYVYYVCVYVCTCKYVCV